MILILTSEHEENVNDIIDILNAEGEEWIRLNSESAIKDKKIEIDFESDTLEINGSRLSTTKSVFFRNWYECSTPKWDLWVTDRSRQVNVHSDLVLSESKLIHDYLFYSLTDAYWMNNIFDPRIYKNRLIQMSIAKKIGFKLPKSFVINTKESLNDVFGTRNDFVVKLIGDMPSSYQKFSYTSALKKGDFEFYKEKIENCGTLVQERIRKKFELRVTVVGNEIFAARIDSQSSDDEDILLDWRHAHAALPIEPVELSEQLEGKILSLMKYFKLEFGALDFIVSEDDEIYFLEINPSGQWQWVEKLTGLMITDAICRSLIRGKQL